MRIAALFVVAAVATACSAGPRAAAGDEPVAAPAGATAEATLTVGNGAGGPPFDVSRSLRLPKGWRAQVWARVPNARIEAWSPEGDLLVSQPNLGRVVELVPRAGAAPEQRIVLTGLTLPQGLAFTRLDGRTVLYVGESDEIDRYDWNGGPGARTVIAGNLPDQDPAGDDDHRPKDVAVAPDGTVYFNVGSASNGDPADRTATPPRALIMSVRPDGTGLKVVETGVRNGEGLAVAPDGTMWTAVNERDNVTYPFHQAYGGHADAFGIAIQSYIDEHPLDQVARVVQGRDLGWPYCNPDQDLHGGSRANVPFAPDAVTNAGGSRLDCARLPRVEVGLPAHSAPVGLTFLEGSALKGPWSNGAVVAVHGSWDREPPRAPAVLWMAWDPESRTLKPAVDLVTGFQNADGSRWGRPADAVPGPDGALYVSDDTAGAIYRLVPPAAG